MAVDADTFKACLGRFASGVTVVTVAGEDGDHGMTASAFSSVSMDPPLVLVCVGNDKETHGRIAAAGRFAVNILADDQVSVSNRFAGWWPQGGSKWSDLVIDRAPESGAAWLGGAIANLDCTLHAAHEAGDHTIFIGRIEHARLTDTPADGLAPLLYFHGSYRSAGAKR
jgi:flavin reductase (DIM6/NTAB) family NADH-FMN oxidoreductase RutF